MQHAGTFKIHIRRPFPVDAIGPDDRIVVGDMAVDGYGIIVAYLGTEQTASVQNFGITGESFLYPHIRNVLCRDAIAEPLMSALMHDDEIPFHAPGRAVVAPAQVAVLKTVAIGYGALVLHTKMRGFHQLVS